MWLTTVKEMCSIAWISGVWRQHIPCWEIRLKTIFIWLRKVLVFMVLRARGNVAAILGGSARGPSTQAVIRNRFNCTTGVLNQMQHIVHDNLHRRACLWPLGPTRPALLQEKINYHLKNSSGVLRSLVEFKSLNKRLKVLLCPQWAHFELALPDLPNHNIAQDYSSNPSFDGNSLRTNNKF